MSKSKLQTALDEFVQAIVGIAEDTAQDTLAARAKDLRTVSHPNRKPMAAKRAVAKTSTKRKSMTKPCPFPDCAKEGAPRNGMMCVDHAHISKKKKNSLRFAAKQPGGVWSDKPLAKKAVKPKLLTKKEVAKAKQMAKAKDVLREKSQSRANKSSQDKAATG